MAWLTTTIRTSRPTRTCRGDRGLGRVPCRGREHDRGDPRDSIPGARHVVHAARRGRNPHGRALLGLQCHALLTQSEQQVLAPKSLARSLHPLGVVRVDKVSECVAEFLGVGLEDGHAPIGRKIALLGIDHRG